MIQTNSQTMTERSESYCVDVKIEGVSTTGVIDTGSDITFIRDLFYHICS